MRKFEKISIEQFSKDCFALNYDDVILPVRKTKYSAGYDFISIKDYELNPGDVKMIPTGIKVLMNSDEYLSIYVRSSIGIKYNIRMCNQVGIIDYDYYNNDSNEGHIWICLKNEGNDKFIIKKGSAFAQGIISKYFICDDDDSTNVRVGGIGSTDRS